MRFASLLASVALALLPSTAVAVTLAYDTVYDGASTSLDVVACSDGTNGLESKGYTTLGSLPNFPHIGAASAVADWNSPNCGTCWQVTYTNSTNVAKTINILAVDHADAGFVLSKAAMNELTNGQAVKLGRIDVASKQVAASVCGL